MNLALLGVINTLVEDGPNKVYIGGLPACLSEEQVGPKRGACWWRRKSYARWDFCF